MEVTVERIEALVRPHLERRQVRLCAVRVTGRVSRPLIQLFVDWEEAPITIAACADISRQILDLFDSQERFAPDYRLEVSSPGVDAPLRETWQFRKNIGRVITGEWGGVRYEARLLDVTAEGVARLEGDDGLCERRLSELVGARVALFPKPMPRSRRKLK